MDYFLNEQQIMIRDLARQIAREKILPVRAELDEREEFPWEIMKALAASDLFAIFVPPFQPINFKLCSFGIPQ